MTDPSTRSGFITVVGRPNVGKSTIVNALVGEKVVITSSRPQTTRNTVRGVVTIEDAHTQLVLIDTPGVHKPRNALGERLNAQVYASLAEADAALFVIEAPNKIGPGDRLIAERLKDVGLPVIVAVNKVDVAGREAILAQLGEAGEWDFAAYVPISATKRDGLDRIVDELVSITPEGPFFFGPDATSDQSEELLTGELIREKYLRRLREELPHSLAVLVDEIEVTDGDLVRVTATVLVERESQKGMVIGKGGVMIRDVGTEARRDLERLFGKKVFLDLRARVERDWQRRDEMLDRMGF